MWHLYQLRRSGPIAPLPFDQRVKTWELTRPYSKGLVGIFPWIPRHSYVWLGLLWISHDRWCSSNTTAAGGSGHSDFRLTPDPPIQPPRPQNYNSFSIYMVLQMDLAFTWVFVNFNIYIALPTTSELKESQTIFRKIFWHCDDYINDCKTFTTQTFTTPDVHHLRRSSPPV